MNARSVLSYDLFVLTPLEQSPGSRATALASPLYHSSPHRTSQRRSGETFVCVAASTTREKTGQRVKFSTELKTFDGPQNKPYEVEIRNGEKRDNTLSADLKTWDAVEATWVSPVRQRLVRAAGRRARINGIRKALEVIPDTWAERQFSRARASLIVRDVVTMLFLAFALMALAVLQASDGLQIFVHGIVMTIKHGKQSVSDRDLLVYWNGGRRDVAEIV